MAKIVKQSGSKYWYAECRDSEGRRYYKSTKQTERKAAERAARQIELEGAVPGIRPYPLAEALSALHTFKTDSLCAAPTLQILSNQGARLLEYFGPKRDINTLAIKEVDAYVVWRRQQLVNTGHRAKHLRAATPEQIERMKRLHAEKMSLREIARDVGLNRATVKAHVIPLPKQQRHITDSTIGKELGKLMEAVLLAKRDGRFPGEPTALRTTLLKAPKGKKRWLPFEEYDLLWQAFERGRIYIDVMVHTGARWGELMRIEQKHLDHKKRELTLIGTKGHQEYQERQVSLSPYIYDLLVRCSYLTSATKPQIKKLVKGPLFWGWSHNKFCVALKRACVRAGIAACSPNDLRRTFTTYHGILGTDLQETKSMLGHSPASRTAEKHYRMVQPAAGKDAAERFPVPDAQKVPPPSDDNVVAITRAKR